MREPVGLYSKEVMKHFKNPRNIGRMENPDGVGKVGNVVCGDVMYLYIKVKKDKKGRNIISDVKFETFGCIAAISTSSMITTIAKGKTIEEAMKISKLDVANALGGLPKIKLHCSVLASDALIEAIYDYLTKNKLTIPDELAKRHEQIKKETEFVEDKFKDYIKMEKEIWGVKEK
jgi:nitrogen fixation NifU-like protein